MAFGAVTDAAWDMDTHRQREELTGHAGGHAQPVAGSLAGALTPAYTSRLCGKATTPTPAPTAISTWTIGSSVRRTAYRMSVGSRLEASGVERRCIASAGDRNCGGNGFGSAGATLLRNES